MAFSRQKFREVVLQLLFSKSFIEGNFDEEIFPFMMSKVYLTKKNIKKAKEKVDDIWKNLSFLDEKIQKVSTSYKLERICKLDLAILRLGVFELFFEKKIHPKVVLAEAIRLCRKFASREGANFINAILDGIYQQEKNSIEKNKF